MESHVHFNVTVVIGRQKVQRAFLPLDVLQLTPSLGIILYLHVG